jgi:hypothetical protein
LLVVPLTLALAALLGCGSDETDPAEPSTSSGVVTGGTMTGATTGSGGSSSSSHTSASSTGAGGGAGGLGGGGTTSSGGPGDFDGDGLDDAFEADVAARYRPFLSVDPGDGCPLGGIVYRVRPHPDKPDLLFVLYDHLYEDDCGLNGHVGDNEAFGVTIDPAVDPPLGIISIKAIGHQNTPCERVSECGSCRGLSACSTADIGGSPMPVVFSSKDKHANYADKGACNPFTTCFDACTLAATPADPPMVNAGEPEGHLTNDLTDGGFITTANGWSEQSLMNFDPWAPGADFGGASVVADDLVDASFIPSCP